MAEINADANHVIALLSDKIASVERENAILVARLHEANRQIDEFQGTKAESAPKGRKT